MVNSMTGFASRQGSGAGTGWQWEIRSVNGRGRDLRLRLPDGIEGLEAGVRAALNAVVQRGSVTLSLRLEAGAGAGSAARLDPVALDAALAALRRAETAAAAMGVQLAPSTAAQILALRGVMEPAAANGEARADGLLGQLLLKDLEPLLAEFARMRAAEGAALARVIAGQIDQIAALVEAAARAARTRQAALAQALRDGVAALSASASAADPGRIEQELALIYVKADVTEEIDRLRAHVGAARTLLAAEGAMGRKLDFLVQEFNREANTLCAKAQSAELTRVGLDLKAVIDQMREQVQNVE